MDQERKQVTQLGLMAALLSIGRVPLMMPGIKILSNEQCIECEKKIPPGRAGRKCKVCRGITPVLLLCMFLGGCNTHDTTPRHVEVQFLRDMRLEDLMNDVKAEGFLGSSDTGIKGSVDLVQYLQEMSKESYPDGDYLSHPGTDNDQQEIPGYKFHSVLGLGTFKHCIYKKSDPSAE